MMLGIMAVSSKSLLKGALVLIVIQARDNATTMEKPEAPMPKINEVRMSR